MVSDFNFHSSLKKVYIIAEIGVNHNGSMELAKKLITEAKIAGADAVKFQTFKAEELATKETPKVKYQINTNQIESHYEMLRKLELSEENHFYIQNLCKQSNITFLSTPYDIKSAKFLNEEINVPLFKTASADIVDIPLHEYIASTLKPSFVSTGMATISEIDKVFQIYKNKKSKIALLHCVSNYPCSNTSINLNVIKSLRDLFNVPIGYSDHSVGTEAAIASISLGAKIIEKHFTVDKSLNGPDHKASSNPQEFAELVSKIRKVEVMLGNKYKELQQEEIEMYKVSRKSLHLAKEVNKGHTLTKEDIVMQRPGDGLSYDFKKYFIGKKTVKCLAKGHKLEIEDI